MLIVLFGSIGRSVTGGQAWANLQYLLGLRRLGHEVYYVEDCSDWSEVYHWQAETHTSELDYPAGFIADALRPYGLSDRWCYRAGDETRGLSLKEVREICGSADLLLIRGIPLLKWRPEFSSAGIRAFVDVDPGFTQFSLVSGDGPFVETVGHSEVVFSYGQNIGRPSCPIPTAGRDWIATVPPVSLESWPSQTTGSADSFTSILRWRGFRDVTFEGQSYGQKDRVFPDYLSLPASAGVRFQIGLTGGPRGKLLEHGWEVVDGWKVSSTPDVYQQFIQQSRAEFGIAKHCYVEGRVGWFSDRTVCYLASGRPAVVQDTWNGDSAIGRPGCEEIGSRGLVLFHDFESALAAVRDVNHHYDLHRVAARRLAEQRFDSDQVLQELLDQVVDSQ